MNIINDAYAQTPQSGGGMSMLIMIGIFCNNVLYDY